MIVTIDDYRGVAESSAAPDRHKHTRDEDVDSQFTVPRAGIVKMKLQALNSALARTPLDQHRYLDLDATVQRISPRMYVDGSEELYFLVKGLPWPSKIPHAFLEAYREVSASRPYTNRYLPRPFRGCNPSKQATVETLFAPTFAMILPLLSGIDSLCGTNLNGFFNQASQNGTSLPQPYKRTSDDRAVAPFAFMDLPAEIRLQIYDHLVPNKAFLYLYPRELSITDASWRLPVCLDIMRTCKTIHTETARHFFSKSTLLLKYRRPLHEGFAKIPGRELEYADRISQMSAEVKRTLTRLEFKIMPGRVSIWRDTDNSGVLAQICATLPNLKEGVISFEKMSGVTTDKDYLSGQLDTIDWLRSQLPIELPIRWDLTYFGRRNQNAPSFKAMFMGVGLMQDQIKERGTLKLVQSADTSQEDLERWSEIKDDVLEAVRQLELDAIS